MSSKKPTTEKIGGAITLENANTSTMSAGSSNSQDSFPAPGAVANASIDGYPGYPTGYPGTAGPQPDYGGGGGQMQRPPSQSNAQTPHAGK